MDSPFVPVSIPFSQRSFVAETEMLGAKSRIISRTRITLTGIANPFSPKQYSRLKELDELISSNPRYATGGLDLLRSLDRKTYNEYVGLKKGYENATKSKAQPGFYATQRQVVIGIKDAGPTSYIGLR